MTRRLAALLVLLLASTASAQLPPDKALEMFKVSDGLEITLWASEPMFVNPSCIDIDHKGRVWVCESVNYRMKLRGQTKMRRPEGDRILVLEDTKGAGKADKVTVFYQAPDIICPLGIACAPYPDGKGMKVYVCHSPHIYVFEDKDGDCKADGPPKILLTGFKGYDHDHGVHGILIGPDNKLYFSVGDQGVKDLQSADGKGRKWTSNSTDCRAGTVWRCDLDGKNLELLAHNFRNNYEPCVDSFGTIFISDNDDDGSDQCRICYVMPGGNYGYHPRGKGQTHWHEEQPGVVPKVLRTGRGSPCGMCFYEGTLLPKKYWGQPLHVDAGPGRLSAYHLKPKGAGYEIDREDMVTSKDSYFRPSDVCVAPDGSVFISDWYDQGVGGHGVKNLEDGRIYRVAPRVKPTSHPPSGDKTIAALESPNSATRSLGMSQIDQMSGNPMPPLRDIARMRPGNPWLSVRLDWQTARVHRRLGEERADTLSRLEVSLAFAVYVHSSQPLPDSNKALQTVRSLNDVWGVTLADLPGAPIKEPLRKEDREKLLRALFDSSSPSLRRELLLSLRQTDAHAAAPMIRSLARHYDGKDRFYLAALGIAVGQPGIGAEIDKRREIILADFEKHFPEWNDKVAGLVWELRPPGMVSMLEKHLGNPRLHVRERGLIVDILATSPTAEAGTALLRTLAADVPLPPDVQERALAHLQEHMSGKWKALRGSPLLDKAIERLLKDEAGKATAAMLITTAEKTDRLPDVIRLAENAKEPSAVRLAAIHALGNVRNKRAMAPLQKIVEDSEEPLPLRVAAVGQLARENYVTLMSVPLFRVIMDGAKHPHELRQAVVAAFAGQQEGSEFLLELYANKKLDAALTPDLARLLRNSPFPRIKKQAEKLLPAPPKLDPKNLPSIPALLARKGNVERGRQVTLATLKNEAQCLRCHTIQGTGGQIGPDLTTIGSKLSREALLESILYPNRAINHQYESWVIETKGGLAVTGLIVEETPDHYVLRDATGKDFKIARNAIDTKVKSKTSLMPDNLLVHIPEEDLVDMVEYLYSLKNPGPVPMGWLQIPRSFGVVQSASSRTRVFERSG